jgi:hypothetical protein
MKLNTLLKSLQKASQALTMLEEAGVNVDRLIGISNAQGPQGGLIKTILAEAARLPDSALAKEPVKVPGSKNKPRKKKALSA